MTQPIQGSARVRIEADTSRLVPDTLAAVQQAVAAAQRILTEAITVGLQADEEPLLGTVAAAQTAVDDLTESAQVVLTGDGQPLQDTVAAAQTAIDGLDESAQVVLDADPQPLQDAVAAAQTALNQVLAVTVPIDGDTSSLEVTVQAARRTVTALADEVVQLPVGADDTLLRQALARARAAVDDLASGARQVTIGGDTTQLVGQMQAATAAVQALQQQTAQAAAQTRALDGQQIRLIADARPLLTAAAQAQQAVEQISGAAELVVLDGDPTRLIEVVTRAQQHVSDLAAGAATVQVDGDPQPLFDAVAAATAAVNGLASISTDVSLGADPQRLIAAVERAQASIERLQQLGPTVTLEADTAPLVDNVERASAAVAGLREHSQGLRNILTAVFAAGAAGAAGLAVAAIRAGAGFNVLSQSINQGLNATLQSRDATRELVADVIELNQTAAFSRQAFLSSAQQLVAFGVAAGQVTATLDAMQQAIVATGGGEAEFAQLTNILARVQSQGRVTGAELARLGILGINLVDLIAQTTGESSAAIQRALQTGRIGLEEISTALATRYAGAVAGYAATWAGALGMIQAGLRNIGSALVEPVIGLETGGFGPRLLNSVASVLFALQDHAATLARILDARLEPAIGRIEDRFAGLADRVANINIEQVIDTAQRGAPAFAALGAAVTTAGSASALSAVGLARFAGVLNPVAAGITALVVASPQLRDILAELLDAVMPLVPVLAQTGSTLAGLASTGLAAVVPVLEPLVLLVDRVVQAFTALPGPVQQATLAVVAFGAALRFAGPLGIALSALAALGAAVELVDSVIRAAHEGFDTFGGSLREVTEDLDRFGRTGRVTGELLGVFGDDLSGLRDRFDAVDDGLNDVQRALSPFVQDWGDATIAAEDAQQAFADIDEALAHMVQQGSADEASEAVSRMADALGLSEGEIGQLLDLLPEYERQMERHAARTNEAAEAQTALELATADASAAIQAQADLVLAQADPIFALNQALRDAEQAQQNFDEALSEHGENSREAQQAALELTEQSIRLQAAVGEAAGVFTGELDPALRDNLIALGLTDEQLGIVEEAFRDTASAGDDFSATYLAQAVLRGDEEALAAFRELTGAGSDYEAEYLAWAVLRGDEDVIDRINNVKNELNEVDGRTATARMTIISDYIEILSNVRGPGLRADGGIVDRPELSWLGEDWQREVVIPLTRPRRALELAVESGLLDVLGQAMRAAPDNTRAKVAAAVPPLVDVGGLLAVLARHMHGGASAVAPAEARLVSVLAPHLAAAGGRPAVASAREPAVVRGRDDTRPRPGSAVVNVHGVSDVDEVADRVIEKLRRRGWR